MPRDPVNRERLLVALLKLSATRGELSAYALLERAETEDDVRAALSIASARIRFLAKRVHPDQGGDPRRFDQLMMIRDAVREAEGRPAKFALRKPSSKAHTYDVEFVTIRINGVEIHTEASSGAAWRESR